jgi:magnesium transporter
LQKILYLDQIKKYSQYLDEKMIDYLGKQLTETFEGFADFDLLSFQWYDADIGEKAVSRLVIYIDREDLFFFCANKKAFQKCTALLAEGQNNERALYAFFVGLFAQDAKRLELLEISITNAEDAALESTRDDYLQKIRSYRKELLRLRRYYSELDTILDNLTANDNDLFSEDGTRHFAIVRNRVMHFCSTVGNLRDYVTQMREACQSQIDLEQNSLMRVFTVAAAIFLPLTLIVGWYGMNFRYMPELSWRYGYPGVVLLSAAVCAVLLLWFRHKKWL